MGYLIEFIVIFILVCLIYKFLLFKNKKRYNKDKLPEEFKLFLSITHVDVEKIGLKKLINRIIILNAIDFGLVILFLDLFDNFFIKLLLGLVFIFIVILGSYKFCGIILKWKGLVKYDES